ncbi:hypothetical protein VN97_g425 [Penicillium thymicola]|uniref:Helitron helicase-like domain-containing protein n=1 Tax=Penicillium thymicola TaxID=293382 RepID=A0AAI9TUI1_PENTH|nr:hypothetical protein VN97_g425 [Penicillium thymicola]
MLLPKMSGMWRLYVKERARIPWLQFLQQNHPGYRNIKISSDRLQNLPDNNSVINQILTQPTDPCPDFSTETDIAEDIDAPVSTAVPNFIPDRTELDAVRDMLPPPNALTLPPFILTPVNEFNRTEPLLSLAFPTLFPYGGAEFTNPRQRSVSYKDYVRHLIKHESARFAQHPRFRFVVFNTIMRHQAAKSAGFYVRRQADRPDITIEELQG